MAHLIELVSTVAHQSNIDVTLASLHEALTECTQYFGIPSLNPETQHADMYGHALRLFEQIGLHEKVHSIVSVIHYN